MSTENGTDGLEQAADTAQPAAPQTNFDRLITHLTEGSLAEKLVAAYAAAEQGKAPQALTDVMSARLDELKREYDAPKDQQD